MSEALAHDGPGSGQSISTPDQRGAGGRLRTAGGRPSAGLASALAPADPARLEDRIPRQRAPRGGLTPDTWGLPREDRELTSAVGRALFLRALDPMLLTGAEGAIWDANPAACRALGRTVDDLRAAGIDGIRSPSDERWDRLAEPGRRATGTTEQLTVRRGDGGSFPAEMSWGEFTVAGRQLALLVFRDVSERNRLEHELRALAADLALQATIDDLTGLLNRRGFLDAAEKEVARARRTGSPLCLLAADVNGLKQVNDRFGHATGDQLLRDVATVLAGTLRAADLIARIGGDEFCVLLTGAHAVADTLSARRRIAAALTRYAQAHGYPCPLSVSIGVVAADASGPPDLRALMDRADKRLYAAKRRRRASAAATC